MLLQVTTGNETFSEPSAASMEVSGLFCPDPVTPGINVHAAVRDSRSGVRYIGAVERLPASQRSDRHGSWSIARLNLPENTLLRMDIKRRSGGAMIYEFFKVYLRMREEAALRQLRIPFTSNEYATQICGYWEGKFDIVQPEWFEPLGIGEPLYPHHYDQGHMGDWFTQTILEVEQVAYRPGGNTVIETASGKKVSLPKPPTGVRKLTLKRK